MHVGVLGGGLQGCCAALALAARGADITIFDRNEQLLSRAAVANEGKIHLGYMYAGDPTLATARTMIAGAFAFAPFFERHLDKPMQSFAVSQPASYVVHRDSQHGVEEVGPYLETVHRLVVDYGQSRCKQYFGRTLPPAVRRWPAAEIEAEFDPAVALAVFDSPEVAINPVELAAALREAMAAHPKIEVRCGHLVTRAERDTDFVHMVSDGPDGPLRERYDHVVNALWEGRLALNETAGLHSERPVVHRLKYGVSFRFPQGRRAPPSATFISGPFGEVVSYADRLTYLTWYSECMRAISKLTAPPDWQTHPDEPLRSQISAGTLRVLAAIMPALRDLDANSLAELSVKGGAIVAWGKTDIYDPQSELHRRYEIGVTTAGRFHSVDPGKLTMAPYFAEMCAARIAPAD